MNNDQEGGSRVRRLAVCQWDCSAGKEQNIRLRNGTGPIRFGQCPVLLISILLFHPVDGLIFLVAFIPLRTTAGGYHANSHLSCNLVFLGTFIVLEALGYWLQKYCTIPLYLATAVISLVTLLILSPSEAKNKPLTLEQRRRNRRRSLILGGLNLAIGIILIWVLQVPASWCTSYYLGVIAASIAMWAAQIKERMCVQ